MDKSLSGSFGDVSYSVAILAGVLTLKLAYQIAAASKVALEFDSDSVADLELLKPHLPAWAQAAIPTIEAFLKA